MNLNRCKYGHLFDSNKNGNICPWCHTQAITGANYDDKDHADTSLKVGELPPLRSVVGWLVCIAGHSRGKDYGIVSDKNFIGTAHDMDIRIIGDNQIAMRNHALISYEPITRVTLLMPGDSHRLVYLNGSAIYGPTELDAWDAIDLGKSRFLFIPFCGIHFDWEELVDDIE